jgi:hypothetical protein
MAARRSAVIAKMGGLITLILFGLFLSKASLEIAAAQA